MFAHRGIQLCTFCTRFIQNRRGGRGLKMSIGHYNLKCVTDVTLLPWWTPSRRHAHGRFGNLYENESVQRYLRQIMEEYREVNRRIQHACLGEAERRELNKRQIELLPVAEIFQSVHHAENDLQEVVSLLDGTAGPGEEDKQLTQLLKEEQEQISQRITALKGDLLKTLVPSDPLDSCDVFLEVVSGRTTGGDICQQFTKEIFDMYQGFAGYKNWDFEVFNYTPAEYGGVHHAAMRIGGEGAYGRLKHEGGTHRVQRIPEVGLSSRMQRIHTGTMTVIVLPQPSEVDISIDPKDLRIDTFRSRGAGGQSVNTTDSAVRIVHLPTGTSAECQQSRSQLKNRDTAMQMLTARLYQSMMGKEVEERHTARKEQVGTRSQSERIRTYNFSQDRVTDHRTGYVTRDIKEFMEGGEALDDLIEDVLEHGEREALLDLVESSLKSVRTTE